MIPPQLCYNLALLVSLSANLATLVVVRGEERTQRPQHDHLRESAEFQAVNSYLTDLQPLSADPTIVRPHLEDAISAIESVGLEKFNEQTNNDLDTKFKTLLRNDPRVLLTIMRNLLIASRSCDEENVSFLVHVVDRQT